MLGAVTRLSLCRSFLQRERQFGAALVLVEDELLLLLLLLLVLGLAPLLVLELVELVGESLGLLVLLQRGEQRVNRSSQSKATAAAANRNDKIKQSRQNIDLALLRLVDPREPLVL